MRARCPNCQVFIEETLDVCPECHFDFRPPPPPEPETAAPRKSRPRDAEEGMPEFMRRESWDVVPPQPTFSKSRKGMVVYLAIGMVVLAGGALVWKGAQMRREQERKERERKEREAREGYVEVIVTTAPVRVAAPPVEAPVSTAPAPALPPPPPERESRWIFHGGVYDLLTLMPVAGAQLVFEEEEEGGHGYEVLTGADGRFRVQVAVLYGRGYRVRVDHPGYLVRCLVKRRAAVRAMPEFERTRIAKELSRTMAFPEPLLPPEEGPYPVDLFLVPKEE